MLRDWIGPKLNLVRRQKLDRVDKSCYLVGRISNEMSPHVRFGFTNLRNLRRSRGIHLSMDYRVYTAVPKPILLCGPDLWPLQIKDTRNLSVLEQHCFRSFAAGWWELFSYY